MNRRAVLMFGALLVGFGVAGFVMPPWLNFLVTVALAKSLVVLGVVLLMRTGLVSFGQALFYAAGSYASAYVVRSLGITDAFLHVLVGLVAGTVLAGLTGALISRYREIFFAMLTLAFSMVFWGVLVRWRPVTGGSDGLRVGRPSTLLGIDITGRVGLTMYVLTVVVTLLLYFLAYRLSSAPLGYVTRAIRDNEIRVSYLGGSVPTAIFLTFLWAGALAGVGGSIQALMVGHVDPTVAVWTTSGEFVFVALISGTGSVFAPLFGAVLFEVARSYITTWWPNLWQLVLGSVMLLIVLFLPRGLWSVYDRYASRSRRRAVA